MIDRRTAFAFVAGALVSLPIVGMTAENKIHKLALQISDNEPEKMNAVINVAANVSRFYSDRGEEVEIEIVAFNAGLHMLCADTSPVKDRVTNALKALPNVSFKAC
jgi:intracellular sulfur oxidation DsrE/DsrF family protein